jgi:hypothetical protein
MRQIHEIAARRQAERIQSPGGGRKPGVNSLENRINRTSGPFIEVGGPTQYFGKRPPVDFGLVEKPLVVSNAPGSKPIVYENVWRSPFFGETVGDERPSGWRGRTYRFWNERPMRVGDGFYPEYVEADLDLHLDATDLPEGQGYVGALYSSALPSDVESPFVSTQAPRVLEEDGMLIVHDVKKESVEAVSHSPYFRDVRVRRVAGNRLLTAQRNGTPYRT